MNDLVGGKGFIVVFLNDMLLKRDEGKMCVLIIKDYFTLDPSFSEHK